MTLEEAIEMAAKDLPEGYEIKVRVERGSAWVVLCDRDGCEEAIDETDMTFAEMVAAAVESANRGFSNAAGHQPQQPESRSDG